MVLRCGSRRPQLVSIPVEEWTIAKSRIMHELMNPVRDVSFSMFDYVAYRIKICQLFKQFDTTSVLKFDREHGYLQSSYQFLLHACLWAKTLGSRYSATPYT